MLKLPRIVVIGQRSMRCTAAKIADHHLQASSSIGETVSMRRGMIEIRRKLVQLTAREVLCSLQDRTWVNLKGQCQILHKHFSGLMTWSHNTRKKTVTTAQWHRLNQSPVVGGECRSMAPPSGLYSVISTQRKAVSCSVALIRFHKMESEEIPWMLCLAWMQNI